MNFLVKSLVDFIKGNKKLWQAYWLILILPQIVGGVIYAITIYYLRGTVTIEYLLLFSKILAITSAIFYIFGTLVSWQCSSNCNNRIWTIIVRLLVVLAPLRLLFIVNFKISNIEIIDRIVLLGVLLMIFFWYFSKQKKINFLGKKYIMPVAIVFVYLLYSLSTYMHSKQLDMRESILGIMLLDKSLPKKIDDDIELTRLYLSDNGELVYRFRIMNLHGLTPAVSLST